MKRICSSKVFFVLFIIFLLFFSTSVSASYDSLGSRIDKNNSMLNSSNKMNSVERARYSNKYLSDFKCTNFDGLTKKEQEKVKSFARSIYGNKKLSNYSKVRKFYEFIVNKFYYYESPLKLSNLKRFGNEYCNPYNLITYEYKNYSKIRSNSEGSAALLVALVRSEGIPARSVGGFYNKDSSIDDSFDVDSGDSNWTFVEIYLNSKWMVFDPMADTGNYYDSASSSYISGSRGSKYFAPSVSTLSSTHIMFNHYPGDRRVSYLSSGYEKKKITTFLNKTYKGKSNGKRINSSYNRNKPSSWFSKSTSSRGDGYGKIKKLYWPSKKKLYGSLDLTGFTSLERLTVTNNRITKASISGSKIISVDLSNNKLSSLKVTGSKNLKYISALGNSLSYAKYNYSDGRSAVFKNSKGGYFSLKYTKDGNSNRHKVYAKPRKGYRFKGWYQGNTKITSKTSYTFTKDSSFTYVAKFEKKPKQTYVLVSIKKQKLWYYKNDKLVFSSYVVTGQKNKYDTPRKTYYILGKARSVYLIGSDYKSFVNYWILIDGKMQIGLHDASWRSSFGGNIYKYNGSHGCVNMPYSKARYVYNNIKIGTRVVIK